MADMYGTLCSNSFLVKDVTAFCAWFNDFSFGDDVDLFTDETSREVSFGGTSFYPSAYPQTEDADGDWGDADLIAFAAALCNHMEDGQVRQYRGWR